MSDTYKHILGMEYCQNPSWQVGGHVFLVADTSLFICIIVLPILSDGRGINLHVQHTPNPEAQDPPLVPPLFVHSSLKKFKRI